MPTFAHPMRSTHATAPHSASNVRLTSSVDFDCKDTSWTLQPPQLPAIGKGKPRHHHTNDRIRLAIKDDGCANNGGVTTEASKPQPVTQEHDPVMAWPMLGSQEGAPQKRLHTEEREEVL